MSKVILAKMTCKELRDVAKEYNISGRWDMTKDQLIEAINKEIEPVKESAEDGVAKVNSDSAEAENKYSCKMDYIEKVEMGVLVAFRLPTGKVKSGKLEKRSSKRRVVKLVTEYGAEFVVPYDDVIWVKTGRRWPRGVFNLLKGIIENEEGKEN